MLTQAEADSLIAMRKRFLQPTSIVLSPGKNETLELVGDPDPKERFFLDLWRSGIKLTKYRFQNRGKRVIVLVRLDLDGAPHTNPDGTRIPGTHLHLYREGFEDRWAYPVTQTQFRDPSNVRGTFDDFCQVCNIIETPQYQDELI